MSVVTWISIHSVCTPCAFIFQFLVNVTCWVWIKYCCVPQKNKGFARTFHLEECGHPWFRYLKIVGLYFNHLVEVARFQVNVSRGAWRLSFVNCYAAVRIVVICHMYLASIIIIMKTKWNNITKHSVEKCNKKETATNNLSYSRTYWSMQTDCCNSWRQN